MSTGQIIAGFVISTVGFSVFLFGKRQRRAPQLLVGTLLMAAPFLLRDPLWMSVAAVVLVAGLFLAVRSGL